MKNSKLKRELPLYAMLVLPMILALLYNYLPMAGLVMAFQDFMPSSHGFVYALIHSKFIGASVFKDLLNSPDALRAIFNTIFIASMKITAKLFVPLIFALLLNEVTSLKFRRAVTTITYIPFFLSWVVLGGILLDFFSPQNGAFNNFIALFGLKPTYFFGTASQFPFAVVLSDLWKEIGYNTIIFLAAIISVDTALYESAKVDGAGSWKQTIHVTIPSIAPMVVLVGILSLGNILNAGYDQIFNLYNPVVYSSGDIIDTFAFRMGIQQAMFSYATAVGLFKSVVSLILISASYFLANKYSRYRVF